MRCCRAVLVVALLATACAATQAPPDPVLLRVVMADDWATAPAVMEAVTRFEDERPGVRVQLRGSPFSQVPDLVAAAEELDQPYDVAHWHAFAAGAAGLARPIDGFWEQHDLDADDYLPGAVLDVTWGDARYGVPLDVNALVLMANPDLLDEAGLDERDLARFDDFAELASELAGTSADHAVTVTASSWATYGWILAAGGDLLEKDDEGVAVLDADGLPTFTFDDPATVAALEMLRGLVADGHAPPALAPDLALDAIADFATGATVLHASGSWDLPIARRSLQPDGEEVEEVRVLPLPQKHPDARRTVLGGSSLFVPVGSEQPELAVEFMLALTDPELGLVIAEQEGRLPALRGAYDAPLFEASEGLATFVEELDHAEVMPLIAFPEVDTAFRDALEAVLAGRTPPDAAMADVQEFAQRWADRR